MDIFFVLSGFLITSILASEWRRAGTIDFGAFYLRRALRLFPALWLMLLAVAFIVPLAYIASTLLYVNNWVMGLGFLPIEPALGHVWSLSIEEQFYLVWPIALLVLLPRFSPRSVALVALGLGISSALIRAGLLVAGASSARVYYGTDSHADGILLGSALGLAVTYGLLPVVSPRWLHVGSIAALVVLLALGLLPVSVAGAIGQPIAVVFAALLLGAVVYAPTGSIPRFLAWRPLVAVGKVSYGLYLWNGPVIMFAQGTWLADAPLVKLLLTFGIVYLSFRFIERPFLRMKDRRSARKLVVQPV